MKFESDSIMVTAWKKISLYKSIISIALKYSPKKTRRKLITLVTVIDIIINIFMLLNLSKLYMDTEYARATINMHACTNSY